MKFTRAPRRSWKKRFDGRLDWDKHVESFEENEFRLFYRVSFELFNQILQDIRHRLPEPNEKQASPLRL